MRYGKFFLHLDVQSELCPESVADVFFVEILIHGID